MERKGLTPEAVQTRSIVRWALFEGAALFNIIVLLITSSLYTVPLIAATLFAHGKTRPRKEQFSNLSA